MRSTFAPSDGSTEKAAIVSPSGLGESRFEQSRRRGAEGEERGEEDDLGWAHCGGVGRVGRVEDGHASYEFGLTSRWEGVDGEDLGEFVDGVQVRACEITKLSHTCDFIEERPTFRMNDNMPRPIPTCPS